MHTPSRSTSSLFWQEKRETQERQGGPGAEQDRADKKRQIHENIMLNIGGVREAAIGHILFFFLSVEKFI